MFARRSNDVPARPLHSPPPRILEPHSSGLRAPVALMYQPPAVVQEVLKSRESGASKSRDNDASTSLGQAASSLQVGSATTMRVIPDALDEISDLKPLGRKSTAYRDIVKSETPQHASAEKASNMFLDLSLPTPFPSPASPTIYDRLEVAPERRPSLVVKLKVKPEKLQRLKDGKKMKSAVVKLKLPNSRLFLSTLKREDERAKSPIKATPTAKSLSTPQTLYPAHIARPQRSSHASQALQASQLVPRTPEVSPTKNAALSLLHFSQNATVAPTTTDSSAKDSYLDLRVGNENVTPKFRNGRVDSMALPTMDYARYPWARPQQSQASVPTTAQPQAPLPPKTTVPHPDLFGTPSRPQSMAPFEFDDGVPGNQVNTTRAPVAIQTQPKQKTKAKSAPLDRFNKTVPTTTSSALDEIIRTAVKRSTSELRLTPSPTEETMFARNPGLGGLPAAQKRKLTKETSNVSNASANSIYSHISVAPSNAAPASKIPANAHYEIYREVPVNQIQVLLVTVEPSGTRSFQAISQYPKTIGNARTINQSIVRHPDDHAWLDQQSFGRLMPFAAPSTSVTPRVETVLSGTVPQTGSGNQSLSRTSSMSVEHSRNGAVANGSNTTPRPSPLLNPKKRPATPSESQKPSTPAAKRNRSSAVATELATNGNITDTSDDVPLSVQSKSRGPIAKMVEAQNDSETDDSDDMPISQHKRRLTLHRGRRVISSSTDIRAASVGSDVAETLRSHDSVLDSPVKVKIKSFADIPDVGMRKKAQTIQKLKATSHCSAGDIYSALVLKRGNVDQAMGVLVGNTYGQVTRQELGLRAKHAGGAVHENVEPPRTMDPEAVVDHEPNIDSTSKINSIEDIKDFTMRKKAQMVQMVTSNSSAASIHAALMRTRGNVDDAMDILVNADYQPSKGRLLSFMYVPPEVEAEDEEVQMTKISKPPTNKSFNASATPKPTRTSKSVTRTSSQEFEKAQDALRSDQRTRGSLAKVNDFIGSSPVKQKQKKNTGNVKAWLERKDLLRAVPSQLMYPVALEDRSLGKKSWSIIEDEEDLCEEIEEEQERLQSSPPKKPYIRMDDPPKPTLGPLFGALSAPSILQDRVNKLEEHVANELLVIQALARNTGVEVPNNELSSAIERRATTWLQHFRNGKDSFEKLCAKQGLFTPTMIEEPEREFAMPEDCQYEMNLRAMTRRHIWSMQQGTGGGLSMQDREMIYRQLMQSESWRIGVSELTPMQSVERERDGTMNTEKSLDVEGTGKKVKRERSFAGMH